MRRLSGGLHKVLLVTLLLMLPLAARAQQNSGEEKFLILPLFGYSDEQGLGVGTNAAWLNISQTSWNISVDLFASALYSQTYLNLQVFNTKLGDVFYFTGGGFLDHSTRGLFYGIGNDSSLANASQYAIQDSYVYARLGVRIIGDFILGTGISHRTTGIDRGTDPTLPQFLDTYSTAPHLSGATTSSLQLFAAYDTRNSVLDPQSGDYGLALWEQYQPSGATDGSDISEQRFIFSYERYWQLIDKELIVATRAKIEHAWGEGLPFFLQSSLGGSTSLRAYRTNRFIDAASALVNLEPRWIFWTPGGSTFERFEFSVGLDLGRVYGGGAFPPSWYYRTGYDFGLTTVLAGGVPLRLDWAPGPETSLIYLHLFYPF